jgi:hypothetical protein
MVFEIGRRYQLEGHEDPSVCRIVSGRFQRHRNSNGLHRRPVVRTVAKAALAKCLFISFPSKP